MITLHRSTLVLAAALALAIACTGIDKPVPEPGADPPTPTATPSVAATKPASTATARPPAAEVSPLQLVALREGSMELMRLGATPAVVLEGEPLPLVDGVPTRGPSGSRGLPSVGAYDSTTRALAGTLEPSGTAWASMEHAYDRAGSLHLVYRNRNQGKGWEQVDLRKGLLRAYDLAYVEREGALLGLRAWGRDPEQDHWEAEDDDPKARAYQRALARALADARPGIVRLEGPKIAAPELPAGVEPFAAVTTHDGTLHVLARELRDGTTTDVLLVWPPGATRAERVEIPNSQDYEPSLATNGELAFVAGVTIDPRSSRTESYLTMGLGTTWERVPVDLPGRTAKGVPRVLAATQTPAGELWIALDDPWQEPDRLLWRKPKGGAWEPVPLPAFGDDLFGRGAGFVYDVTGTVSEGWSAIERPTLADATPRATALAWIDGAVWVVLELGEAYEGGADMSAARTVLLSTRRTQTEPARLPARWELYVERHNVLYRNATPGKEACRRQTLVLGPASLHTRPGLVDAVRAPVSTEISDARIYTGRLDDQDVLVASVHTLTPAESKAMKHAVAKASGTTPTLDCRIPELDRMLVGE